MAGLDILADHYKILSISEKEANTEIFSAGGGSLCFKNISQG